MDLPSDDSDAEFFDAREDISTPKSPDQLISNPLEEALDESNHGSNQDLTKRKYENEEERVEDVCDGVANATEFDSANTENLLKRQQSLEASEFAGQTPDLLACVQDRPTDLPGVKPVKVAPSPQEEITYNAQQAVEEVDQAVYLAEPAPLPLPEDKKEEVPMTVHKPPRPESSPENRAKKKVPPARPAPPKRPPPPKKSYLVSKPYVSESDEGLLTPNTTVDNLTREFAEALKKDESMQQKSPSSNISTEPKPTATVAETATESSLRRKGSVSSHKSSASPASTLNRDEEILAGVIVKNLDTGESMPLSTAAEHVSSCLNPLALQIMSRTREFSYTSSTTSVNSHEVQSSSSMVLERQDIRDSDSLSLASDDIEIGKDAAENKQRKSKKLKDKQKKLRKFVGKGMSKVKVVAGAQVEKAVHKVKRGKEEEQLNFSSDEDSVDLGSSSSIKIKTSSSNKGPYHFSHPKQVQDIAVHVGAVWCMKFSHCGRLLATSGQDNVIWVWVLKEFYNYFNDMRIKYDSKDEVLIHRPNMTPSEISGKEEIFIIDEPSEGRVVVDDDEDASPFRQVPFSSYVGHSADVLDLAWSKNYFVLSSSMDKTVRLWHISRKECLCCFQHIDFVTAIAFHPRDDRYFLSGSLDSKLRLWNIPDKKVALWNEVSPEGSSASSSATGGALITTVNFCENGKFAVCGTYDGRCVFFDTEHLKYHTQIHVRSSRGRNTKGHKVTGIEPLPGEHKILVTSNDSRVRLYDLRDLSLVCKYRGHANMSSQIKASFSPDAKYIICGSEDKCVYIWKTSLPQDIKLSSLRRDRNDAWESMKTHDAVVTCAVFAPQPRLLYKDVSAESSDIKHKSKTASILSLKTKKQEPKEVNVIISADFSGCIKVTVCAE